MKKVRLLAMSMLLLLVSVTSFASPPPFTPSNSCEAQCLVDFRSCDRICSENPCLVSCEFLLDLCLSACNAA